MPDNSYDRLRLVADNPPRPDHESDIASGPGPGEGDEQEPTFATSHAPQYPYRVLGHDRGTFFFLTERGGQVLAFAGRDLSRDTVLMQLAPLMWWESEFPSKSGANTKAAANALIAASYRMGVYDPDRVRGRGAWLDGDRSVLHLGDRLLVDNQEASLDLPDSRYVYEAARPLSLCAAADPLSTPEAHKLVKLCCRFAWEREVSGTLIAGWIAIAPICGALAWRPSVWLTGGSASGKTTIQNKIVIPALGGMALAVQSKTSEAGIRQALGSDARPVVFDEAEREDQDAARRMQAVIDLARQSSSEGGAEIIKGSSNQSGARRFRVRSCFLFSSINVGLEHTADENRITVMALSRPKMTGPQFTMLERDIANLLTPEYATGLLARSVSMLTTIRQNAETFARAIAAHLRSRRAGDQLGALLAGAYSLHSTKLITLEGATEFVKRHKWDEAPDPKDKDTDTDERRLLAHLMQHRVRVGGGTRAQIETTIGMLTQAVTENDGIVPKEEANAALKSHGIKYDEEAAGFVVANRHPDLAVAFRGTPWSVGWGRTLARLGGATDAGNVAIRFGPGVVSKATYIPLALLEEGTDSSEN